MCCVCCGGDLGLRRCSLNMDFEYCELLSSRPNPERSRRGSGEIPAFRFERLRLSKFAREHLYRHSPLCTEIVPGWVAGNNKGDFFDTRPTLQLLFPCDCNLDIAVALNIYETRDVVACGEAIGKHFIFVLCCALLKLGRQSDVEAFGVATEDVDVSECFHALPLCATAGSF